MRKRTSKKFNYFMMFAVLCFIEVFYFRNILFTDALIGDSGDTRLNNLILEHWYRVVMGQESFADLIIFYPKKNTITYTDMLCGYAIPYIFLRIIGIGLYNANKIVLIFIHSMGSLGVVLLLRKVMDYNWFSTIIGVILFSLSNAVFVQAGHSQLYTVSMVPFLIIFIILFFSNIKGNKITKKKFGFGIIVAYVFIMYTSFYIAFFSALLVIIYGVVVFTMADKRKLMIDLKDFFILNYRMIICYILFSFIIMLPFFYLYLPTLKEFGVRNWDGISLPSLIDYIGVSSDSYMYAAYKSKFNLSENIELSTGIPIFTSLIFVLCYLWIRKKYYSGDQKEYFYIRALCITVVLTWILLLKSGSYSLWWVVYKFIPGGGAIRAPFRINLIIALFIAVIAASVFHYYGTKLKRAYIPFALLCGVVLLFDNLTASGVPSYWNVKDMTSQIDKVSEPPEDCKVVLLINSGAEMSFHDSNLLAWEIANKFHLKTVNGYSGQFPKEWPVNNYVYNENSLFGMCNWIDNYDLEDVYAYDLATGRWSKDFPSSYMFDEKDNSMLIHNGIAEEESVALFPGGFIWGPYITLTPNQYLIYIKSAYINQVELVCTSNGGQKDIPISKIEQSSEGVSYKISLDEMETQVEFKILNNSPDIISFDYIKIIRE